MREKQKTDDTTTYKTSSMSSLSNYYFEIGAIFLWIIFDFQGKMLKASVDICKTRFRVT